MILATILAAVAVAGATLYVVWPLFRVPEQQTTTRADALAQRQLKLLEERDRALAALKELEFDHRTGKISDHDYRELIGPLRRHAVETLRSLERGDPAIPVDRPRPEERTRVRAGG